jgi:hypothetical protein
VHHGQQRAERPDPIRPDPKIHQGDDLHLHVDDQERGRDGHQQDHRRRDDEPDDGRFAANVSTAS